MTGTLLVTGATGFVGRQFVPAVVAAGWSVRPAARAGGEIAGLPVARMPDLASPRIDWRPLLEGVTHVVHLAGLAHMTESIPEATYRAVNADAAVSLAEAARQAGVRRVVLVSSIRAQSGPVGDASVRESDPPAPTDAYGRSKLAGEQGLLAALADGGTEGIVLRPVLVYGPGVKANMGSLFKLARLPVPLPLATLAGKRSIVSAGNLASAILHALTSPRTTGGTYLVADTEPVSVPQIIAALRRGLGRSPGLFPVPLSPVGPLLRLAGREDVWDRIAGSLVADTSLLRATGWNPPEDTASALAAAIRAQRGS